MPAHILLADIRHAIRRLVASPSFSLVAVLSLGLGIGANTAVVSVARAALFETLPIERPEELFFVFWGPRLDGLGGMYSDGRIDPATGKQMGSNISFPAYQQLKQLERSGVLLGAFTFMPRTNVVIAGRPAEGATAILADGTFFNVVRQPVAIGRGLTPADDRPDAPLAAVISYDFWQRAFSGASTALDQSVTVNGVPARIVGVTARGFQGMSPGGFRPVTDITLPLALQPQLVPGWSPRRGSLFTDPRTLWVRAIVRLPEEGAGSFEQMASASLRAHVVAAGIVDAPGAAPTYARLEAAGRGVNLDTASMRTSIIILGIVSAAMLVVACLNLAGLLLARGLARRRELSVRAALGASRWQLMQLALLESTLLAGAGGALGIGLAFVSRDLLGSMHYTSVRATPPPTLFDHYARHAQESLTGLTFILRSDEPAAILERPLRAAVAQASPATGITGFRSQTAQIAQTLGRERVFARLLTLVGAFGLLLAAIGLHGITAYSVAQRTSEIGVRLALGATSGRVLWMVLRQVAGIALAGLAVGVPAALAAGPLLRSLLFGLGPADAPTLGIAAVTLLSISVLAGWIPARRAAALDPLTAIRRD